MISVTVNGKKRELESLIGLVEFLKENNIDTRFVAIAHNGVIVSKEQYQSVALKDGDTLEIIRPVGGG